MKDPSQLISGDSLQVHKTQSTAEQTMERLIFSLSELEHLGQTLISGHSNFNHSSKTYLRITLGTLQVTRGAILRHHQTRQNLEVVASSPDQVFAPITVEPSEIEELLQHPFIESANLPESLEPFFARTAKFIETIDIRLWVPLKIHDELLGMIGLGSFLGREALETWEMELLTTLAHQISIAIAYSQMVEGVQSEKFRLFMLAESAPQICQLLQPEAAAEQVVHQAVSLLDANAGALMLTHAERQELEMHYTFPETLIESSTPDADPNGLVLPYGEEAPISLETTSVDMLKSVVTEGLPGHCPPKSDTLFGGKNLMAVPIPGRDGDILGILVVGDKEERGGSIAPFTDEDVILLDSFAKQAGVAIENARLHQEALEARQLQAEMEEARKIQENLIPETLPDIPGYEIAGHYEPRGPVGGDYYDCIPLSTGHWGLAIADVSGKGMQAALLMATLRAGLISELSRGNGAAAEDSGTPNDRSVSTLYAELIKMALTLNSLLYASGTAEKYATFFYSHLNPETDVLTTLNAGHNPPLLIKKDGTYKWLGEEIGGIPLGMFPNDMVSNIAEYEAEHVQLTSGDVVIYYTDGVTETENVDDEYYEEDRLVEDSKACKDSDAEGILKYLHDAVVGFQGEADQFDDLTLLILRKQ